MDQPVLMIRNMVCPRCIEAVDRIMAQHEIKNARVSLGRVVLENGISPATRKAVADDLLKAGFELLDDPRAQLVSEIKRIVIEHVRTLNGPAPAFSRYLSDELNLEFTYLSRLFSSVEGITLERYILRVKTEYVKELLIYGEFTLSEIAFRLDYSSTAHLSSQFKKETGMTPTQFRKLTDPDRRPLDQL